LFISLLSLNVTVDLSVACFYCRHIYVKMKGDTPTSVSDSGEGTKKVGNRCPKSMCREHYRRGDGK